MVGRAQGNGLVRDELSAGKRECDTGEKNIRTAHRERLEEKVETERKRWIVGDEVGGMRGESRRANRAGGGALRGT